MKILITGSSGFVGKYLIAQLLTTTNHTLLLPIRVKKNQSGRERFEREFLSVSLFGTDRLQHALRTRVTVLEGDVAALRLKDLEGVDCVVHNAANVSFFDNINNLKRDNVDTMTHLCDLVQQTTSITRFLFNSTCYVHTKDNSTGGKATLLPSDLPESKFINPYAYSKYLAEQELVAKLHRIEPEIIRLSIVGAPLGYFSAHPFRGAAHLSILAAIFMNRLSYVWIPNSVRLNILPVDCIVEEIVEHIQTPKGKQVKQLCAPADQSAYHLSLRELGGFLKTNYKTLLQQTTLSTVESFEDFVSTLQSSLRIPKLLEYVTTANRVVQCVSHTPWFECSLPPEKILPISPEKHIQLTCQYVLRTLHENQLRKGIALTNSDLIMKTLENPTINVEVKIPTTNMKDLKDNLYHAFSVDRKTVAILQNGKWVHRGFLKQGEMILQMDVASRDEAIQWALAHPIPLQQHLRILLFMNEQTLLTTICQYNHIFTDGMGTLLHADSIFEGITQKLLPIDTTHKQKAPRELPLLEDIWVGLKYGAWLLVDCAKQIFAPDRSRTTQLSYHMMESDVKIRHGMTFTESYAKDLVEVQTEKEVVRLCIPTNTASPFTRVKEISKNQTSLYYIDVPKGQSENDFRESFKVFRSATAKWIALFLGAILASWAPWLVQKCSASVDVLFSSIYTPNYKKDSEPRVLMPLQEQQKIGVCALTLEDTTFHTIIQRGQEGKAAALGEALVELWSRK